MIVHSRVLHFCACYCKSKLLIKCELLHRSIDYFFPRCRSENTSVLLGGLRAARPNRSASRRRARADTRRPCPIRPQSVRAKTRQSARRHACRCVSCAMAKRKRTRTCAPGRTRGKMPAKQSTQWVQGLLELRARSDKWEYTKRWTEMRVSTWTDLALVAWRGVCVQDDVDGHIAVGCLRRIRIGISIARRSMAGCEPAEQIPAHSNRQFVIFAPVCGNQPLKSSARRRNRVQRRANVNAAASRQQ